MICVIFWTDHWNKQNKTQGGAVLTAPLCVSFFAGNVGRAINA